MEIEVGDEEDERVGRKVNQNEGCMKNPFISYTYHFIS